MKKENSNMYYSPQQKFCSRQIALPIGKLLQKSYKYYKYSQGKGISQTRRIINNIILLSDYLSGG